MKYLRHLFRQPLKNVTGVILVTIAVAILCVSVGQAFAVRTTEQRIHDQFTTVAMPVSTLTMPEDLLSWLETTAAEHPDIIKTIAKQGFLSAYIPELTAMNYTNGKYVVDNKGDLKDYLARPYPDGRPYSCAMMVITLEEIGDIKERNGTYISSEILTREDFASNADYLEWQKNKLETKVLTYGYTRELVGTVTQVVSMHEGFRDPTGMTIRLTLAAPTPRGELNSLDLKPGEQYIVYGMDYYDEDWDLRGYLADEQNDNPVEIDAFDMSQFHILTEEDKAAYKKTYNVSTAPYARYGAYGSTVYLAEKQYKMVNSVSMSLALPIPDMDFEIIRDGEKGKVIEVKFKTDYTCKDGENYVSCSAEEYSAHYRIPTIAYLDDSVEDFLNSAEGSEWRAALERDAVNNSSFAVIGVDKLGYLFDFVRGDSRITSGRDFTAEEIENGSRVCIMHEALAEANGLQVGDTIPMNFYQMDTSLPFDKRPNGQLEYLTPTASFYFDTTPITETAEYTIVGLWRGEELWPDPGKNEYAFLPNTIFIPNNSTETEMEYRESILYTTPIIHNGKLAEFRAMAVEAGYDDRFMYFDRGYSVIMKNFFNYENLAVQVLTIGVTIYSIIILLYLMLYPGSHFKAVRTMESLGVSYFERSCYVLMSSMSIVTVSSALGIFTGFLLWEIAVGALQTSAEAASALTIEPGTLIFIVIAQFGIVLLLNVLVSLFVAMPKKMSARR